MASRIYTRTGDRGETGLYRGGRVSKSHPRVTAYGTVDELCAALGFAGTQGPPDRVRAILNDIQSLLFDLAAELATPPDAKQRPPGVTTADVEQLEREIDRAEAGLEPLESFILPTGTPAAAALHLARAICRRAERACVALREVEPETTLQPITFLNRLSDLLFVLARVANNEGGAEEIPWKTRD